MRQSETAEKWSQGQNGRAKSALMPRRRVLTASFLTMALSVIAKPSRADEAPPSGERRSPRDESNEMTAHRRDYYRRARF